MNEKQKIAFFNRARPQNCDALEIFRKAGRVFLGYPLWRHGVEYNPNDLHSCLVDPIASSDDEWKQELEWKKIDEKRSPQMFSRNRNFIPSVIPGSIVVVPRQEEGQVYIAQITSEFEVLKSPDWAKQYLQLRETQGADIDDEYNKHIGDVAQGWQIDEYKPIGLHKIPMWLRNRMFSRSTFGRFDCHPILNNITAYEVLSDILNGNHSIETSWTLDLEEIKLRLLDSLTPYSFENLVVALLQLENQDQIWQQTGGVGDGGIDGLGSNENGEVVGLMQAKLKAWSMPELSKLGYNSNGIKRYAAVLFSEDSSPASDGTIHLDLEWIANKVLCHYDRLPQALAMRIGKG